MGDWKDLDDGEVELLLGTELLWRQITKSLWDEKKEQPHSHAFGPKDADEGMPSFSRESKVTAQESRDWHQKNGPSSSLSVWSIATEDVDGLDLRIVDDEDAAPRPGHKRAPGHAFLDYREMDKRTERTVRAVLFRKSLGRKVVPTTDIGFVPLDQREDKAS